MLRLISTLGGSTVAVYFRSPSPLEYEFATDRFAHKYGTMNAEYLAASRQHMLAEIAAETIYASARIGKAAVDERVMAAMAKVPRHEFVPIELQPHAYANMPLPIGFEKTISQPFIVALMTDLLDIRADDTVFRDRHRARLSGGDPRGAGAQGV